MPQATDLVVKDGANVDKTFTLISPAAGDGGIAEWALREGTIPAVFPRFTASSTNKSTGSRGLKTKFKLPASYTDSVTGLTNVNAFAEMNCDVTVPAAFPEDRRDDFVAFATNIFKTTLLQAMIRDAYPAT